MKGITFKKIYKYKIIITKNLLEINSCEFRIKKDVKELLFWKKLLLLFKL